MNTDQNAARESGRPNSISNVVRAVCRRHLCASYEDLYPPQNLTMMPTIPVTFFPVVHFFIADDSAHKLTVFPTLLKLIADTPLDSPRNNHQLLAYYLSLFTLIFSDMVQVGKDYLASRGYQALVIKLPSQAAANNLVMEPAMELTEIALAFEPAVLLLYKNVNDLTNFSSYQNARTLHLYYPIQVANYIKGSVGTNRTVRISVLDHLIMSQNDPLPFGPIYNDILRIISWTDMSLFQLLNETFIVTKSPVLKDRALIREIINLAEALKAVRSSPQPEYFRIRAGYMESHILDRNHFRILLNTAIEIKKASQPAVRRFIRSMTASEQAEVARLKAIHDRAVTQMG